MGNDGGSIPTRRELVKEGARDPTTAQVKEIQTEQQEHYWSTCALSHEPLSQPIVSDALGTLYNKAAVLDHLLANAQDTVDKHTAQEKSEAFKGRIRSLKDVVEVRFQTAGNEELALRWTCPITNKTLGPGVKAVYLVPCGHAFAESVVKEMPGEICLQCNEPYRTENIIPLLPTSQIEKDRLTQRIHDLKANGLTHSLKKAQGGKKRKKAGPADHEAAADESVQVKTLNSSKDAKIATVIKNQETASLIDKVLAEQEDRNKRRKMGTNENVKSLFSSKNGMDEKHVDFMTRGFSIPANTKR